MITRVIVNDMVVFARRENCIASCVGIPSAISPKRTTITGVTYPERMCDNKIFSLLDYKGETLYAVCGSSCICVE